MKKMIIILGCILLGCYIFNIILGDNPNSLKTMQKSIMTQELDCYISAP